MLQSAKPAVKTALGSAGYSVVKTGATSEGHERVYPHATYAPWSVDAEFLRVYEVICAYTLVDKYRCWELWSLAGQTEHLPGDCLEIRVWRVGTGCLIARRAKNIGLNGDVFLCDTFNGVVKAGAMGDTYEGGEHSDAREECVCELAARLLVNVKLLRGVFPEETATKSRTGHFASATSMWMCTNRRAIAPSGFGRD